MKQNTEALKAQARRQLNVRPTKGLPDQAVLEVSVRLKTASGEIIPEVSHREVVLQPLHADLRELHLNAVHRTLRAVTEVTTKAYDEAIAAANKKSERKPDRIPNAILMPVYDNPTDPQVAGMLDQTKAKAKPADEVFNPTTSE